MVDSFKPLQHYDADNMDDETLKRDARAQVAKWAHLQVVAELLTRLRASSFPWWSPTFTREQWRPHARMGWLAQRSDVRQRITTALTGLPRNASRSRTPEFQAALIDSVLEHGDVDDAQFDEQFSPSDMVVYGPVNDFWTHFRARMPWEDDSQANQRLVGWLLRVLTSDRCTIDGEVARKPILSALDVRTAIDARVWQDRIPAELRAAVDDARMKHERARPREPFQARHEMQIITPELIAQHVPLLDLTPVVQAAERGLFSPTESVVQTVPRESGSFDLSLSSRIPGAELAANSVRPFSLARTA